MTHRVVLFIACIFLSVGTHARAENKTPASQTQRFVQIENDKVRVWRTRIAPKQPLKYHRHDKARVVVPLTDTKLKIVSDKGVTKTVEWKKGAAYWLDIDKAGELHADVNEGSQPVEVMIIEVQ